MPPRDPVQRGPVRRQGGDRAQINRDRRASSSAAIKAHGATVDQLGAKLGIKPVQYPWWYHAARGIDVPGRTIRSFLMGDIGRDVWKEGKDEHGIGMGGASGWDLMHKWFGLKDTAGKVDMVDVGAFAIEVATDPLSWLLGGFGFNTKAGKLADKIRVHETNAIANAGVARAFRGALKRGKARPKRGAGAYSPKRSKRRTVQELERKPSSRVGHTGVQVGEGEIGLVSRQLGPEDVGRYGDHLDHSGTATFNREQLRTHAKREMLADFYQEIAKEELVMANRLRKQLQASGKSHLMPSGRLSTNQTLRGRMKLGGQAEASLKQHMKNLDNVSLDELLDAAKGESRVGKLDVEKLLESVDQGRGYQYHLSRVAGRGHNLGSFDVIGHLKQQAGQSRYMLEKVASGEIPRLNALMTLGVPALPIPNKRWPLQALLYAVHGGGMSPFRATRFVHDAIPGLRWLRDKKFLKNAPGILKHGDRLRPLKTFMDLIDWSSKKMWGLRAKLREAGRQKWVLTSPKYERNLFQGIGRGLGWTYQSTMGRLHKMAGGSGDIPLGWVKRAVESEKARGLVGTAAEKQRQAFGRGFEHKLMRKLRIPLGTPEGVGGLIGGSIDGFSGDPDQGFWKKFVSGGLLYTGVGLGHLGRRAFKGTKVLGASPGLWNYKKKLRNITLHNLFKTTRSQLSTEERAILEAFERSQVKNVDAAAELGAEMKEQIGSLQDIVSGDKRIQDIGGLMEAERGPALEQWYVVTTADDMKGEMFVKSDTFRKLAKEKGWRENGQFEVPVGWSDDSSTAAGRRDLNKVRVWRDVIYEQRLTGHGEGAHSEIRKILENNKAFKKQFPDFNWDNPDAIQDLIDKQVVRVKRRGSKQRGKGLDLMGRLEALAEEKGLDGLYGKNGILTDLIERQRVFINKIKRDWWDDPKNARENYILSREELMEQGLPTKIDEKTGLEYGNSKKAQNYRKYQDLKKHIADQQDEVGAMGNPDRTYENVLKLVHEPHKWSADAREWVREMQDRLIQMLDDEADMGVGGGSSEGILRTVAAYYPRQLHPAVRELIKNADDLEDFVSFVAKEASSDPNRAISHGYMIGRNKLKRDYLTTEMGMMDFLGTFHEAAREWIERQAIKASDEWKLTNRVVEKTGGLWKFGDTVFDTLLGAKSAQTKAMSKALPFLKEMEGNPFIMNPAHAIAGRQIMSEMTQAAGLLQQVTIQQFFKPIQSWGDNVARVAAKAGRNRSSTSPLIYDNNYPARVKKSKIRDKFVEYWEGVNGPLDGASAEMLDDLSRQGWPASTSDEIRGLLSESDMVIPSVTEFVKNPDGSSRPAFQAFYNALMESPAVQSGVIGERELAYMRAIFNDIKPEVMERLVFKGGEEGGTSLMWKLLPEEYGYWGGAARYERPNVRAMHEVLAGKGGDQTLEGNKAASHGAGRPFTDQAYETTGNIIGLHPELKNQPSMFKVQVMMHEIFHVLWEDAPMELRKGFTEVMRSMKARGEMGDFTDLIKAYLGDMRNIVRRNPRKSSAYADDVDKILEQQLETLYNSLIKMGGDLENIRTIPKAGTVAALRQAKPELMGESGGVYRQQDLDRLIAEGQLKEMGISPEKLTAQGIEGYLAQLPQNFKDFRSQLLGDYAGHKFIDQKRAALTFDMQVTGGPLGSAGKKDALQQHQRWETFVAQMSQGAADSPGEMFATLSGMIMMGSHIPHHLAEDPQFLALFARQGKGFIKSIKSLFVKSRQQMMKAEAALAPEIGQKTGTGESRRKLAQEMGRKPGIDPDKPTGRALPVSKGSIDNEISLLESRMKEFRELKERGAIDAGSKTDFPSLRAAWQSENDYIQMERRYQELLAARDDIAARRVDPTWGSAFQELAGSYQQPKVPYQQARAPVTTRTSARTFGEDGQHMIAMIESMARMAMGVDGEMQRMVGLIKRRNSGMGFERAYQAPSEVEKKYFTRFHIKTDPQLKFLKSLYDDISDLKNNGDFTNPSEVERLKTLERQVMDVEQDIGRELAKAHRNVDRELLPHNPSSTSAERAKEAGAIPHTPTHIDTGVIRSDDPSLGGLLPQLSDDYTGQMENLFDSIDMEFLNSIRMTHTEPTKINEFIAMPVQAQQDLLGSMETSQVLQYRWNLSRKKQSVDGMTDPGAESPGPASNNPIAAQNMMDDFGMNVNNPEAVNNALLVIDEHLMQPENLGAHMDEGFMNELPVVQQLYWSEAAETIDAHPRFLRLVEEGGVANPNLADGSGLDGFVQDIYTGFEMYDPVHVKTIRDQAAIVVRGGAGINRSRDKELRVLIASGGFDPGNGAPAIRSFHAEDLQAWAQEWFQRRFGGDPEPFRLSRHHSEELMTQHKLNQDSGMSQGAFSDLFVKIDDLPIDETDLLNLSATGRRTNITFEKLVPTEKEMVIDMYLDFVNASRSKLRNILEEGDPADWGTAKRKSLPPRSQQAIGEIGDAGGASLSKQRQRAETLLGDRLGADEAGRLMNEPKVLGQVRDEAADAAHMTMKHPQRGPTLASYLKNIDREQFDALTWSRVMSFLQINNDSMQTPRVGMSMDAPPASGFDPRLNHFKTHHPGGFDSQRMRGLYNALWGQIAGHRQNYATRFGASSKGYEPLTSDFLGAQGLRARHGPGAGISSFESMGASLGDMGGTSGREMDPFPFPFSDKAGRSPAADSMAFFPELDVESIMQKTQLTRSEAEMVAEKKGLELLEEEALSLRAETDDLYRAINEWFGDPSGAPESAFRSDDTTDLFQTGINRAARRHEFAQGSMSETMALSRYMEKDFPRFKEEVHRHLRVALGDEAGDELFRELTQKVEPRSAAFPGGGLIDEGLNKLEEVAGGLGDNNTLTTIYKMLQHDKLNNWSFVSKNWQGAGRPQDFMAALEEVVGKKMMNQRAHKLQEEVGRPLIGRLYEIDDALRIGTSGEGSLKELREILDALQDYDLGGAKNFLEDLLQMRGSDMVPIMRAKIKNALADIGPKLQAERASGETLGVHTLDTDELFGYNQIVEFFQREADSKIDINSVRPEGTPYGSQAWHNEAEMTAGGMQTTAPGMWLSPDVNTMGGPMAPRFAAARILGLQDEMVSQLIKEKGWDFVWTETEKVLQRGKQTRQAPIQREAAGDDVFTNQQLSPERVRTQQNPDKWAGTPGHQVNLHRNYGNPEKWWAGQMGYADLRDVPSHYLVRPVAEGDWEKVATQLYAHKPADVTDLEWQESIRHVQDYLLETRVNPVAARLYQRGQLGGPEGAFGRSGALSGDVPAGAFGADPEELAATVAQIRASIAKRNQLKKSIQELMDEVDPTERGIFDQLRLTTQGEFGTETALQQFIKRYKARGTTGDPNKIPVVSTKGEAIGPVAEDPVLQRAELLLMQIMNTTQDVRHHLQRVLDLDYKDGLEVIRRELDEMRGAIQAGDSRGWGDAGIAQVSRRKMSGELNIVDQSEYAGMPVTEPSPLTRTGESGSPIGRPQIREEGYAQAPVDEFTVGGYDLPPEFFDALGRAREMPGAAKHPWSFSEMDFIDESIFNDMERFHSAAQKNYDEGERVVSQAQNKEWLLEQLDENEIANLTKYFGEDKENWPYWRIRRALNDQFAAMPERERSDLFAQMARTITDMRGKGFSEKKIMELQTKIQDSLAGALDREALQTGNGPIFMYDGKVWPDADELAGLSMATDLRTFPELMNVNYIDNSSWGKSSNRMGLYEFLQGGITDGKPATGQRLSGFASPKDGDWVSVPHVLEHEKLLEPGKTTKIDPLQQVLVDRGLGKFVFNEKTGGKDFVDAYYMPRETALRMLDVKKKMFEPSEIKQFFRAISKWNGRMKSSITRYFPGFYTRNIVSDSALSWVSGAFDPAVHASGDAWAVALAATDEPLKSLPEGHRLNNAKLLNSEIDSYGGFMGSRVTEIAKAASDEAYDSNFTMFNQMLGRQMLNSGKDPGTVKRTLAGLKTLLVMGMPPEYIPRIMEMGLSDIMELPEKLTRSAHVLAKMKQGETFLESVRHMKINLLDYSDLTVFEKKWLANARMFYTWTRKIIPLLMDQLAKYPNRTAILTRGTFNPSMPRDDFVPDFVRKHAGYVFGNNWFWGWGSPQEELLKLDPYKINGASVGYMFMNLFHSEMSSMQPQVKYALELGTGKDIYQRREIADIRTVGPEGKLLEGAEWALNKIGGATGFGKLGDEYINYRQVGGDGVEGQSLTRSANPHLLHFLRQPPHARFYREFGRILDILSEQFGEDMDPRKSPGQQVAKLFGGARLTGRDFYSGWISLRDKVKADLHQEYIKGNVSQYEIWSASENAKLEWDDTANDYVKNERANKYIEMQNMVGILKRINEEAAKAKEELRANPKSGSAGTMGGQELPFNRPLEWGPRQEADY